LKTIRGAAADEVLRFESLHTKNPSLEYFGLALFIGVKDNDQEFVSAATRGPSSQSHRLLSAIFWRRREAAHGRNRQRSYRGDVLRAESK
jgi:hypothetical protein